MRRRQRGSSSSGTPSSAVRSMCAVNSCDHLDWYGGRFLIFVGMSYTCEHAKRVQRHSHEARGWRVSTCGPVERLQVATTSTCGRGELVVVALMAVGASSAQSNSQKPGTTNPTFPPEWLSCHTARMKASAAVVRAALHGGGAPLGQGMYRVSTLTSAKIKVYPHLRITCTT